MIDYDKEMDMPTPCQHCGELFDLINDGGASSKWYPNTIICPQCSDEEDKEIEEDDRWETINNEISNALYDLENEDNLKSRVSEDNIIKILKIAQKLN